MIFKIFISELIAEGFKPGRPQTPLNTPLFYDGRRRVSARCVKESVSGDASWPVYAENRTCGG